MVEAEIVDDQAAVSDHPASEAALDAFPEMAIEPFHDAKQELITEADFYLVDTEKRCKSMTQPVLQLHRFVRENSRNRMIPLHHTCGGEGRIAVERPRAYVSDISVRIAVVGTEVATTLRRQNNWPIPEWWATTPRRNVRRRR